MAEEKLVVVEVQVVVSGRELGLGEGGGGRRGRLTLLRSRRGPAGRGSGGGGEEQGSDISRGREGLGGEVKAQVELKVEVLLEGKLEVEEMKVLAPLTLTAPKQIPHARSTATASASATSPATRSAGGWETLSVEELVAKLGKVVVMT